MSNFPFQIGDLITNERYDYRYKLPWYEGSGGFMFGAGGIAVEPEKEQPLMLLSYSSQDEGKSFDVVCLWNGRVISRWAQRGWWLENYERV